MKKYAIYLQSITLIIVLAILYGFSKYRAAKESITEIQVIIADKSLRFLSEKLVKKMLKKEFHITQNFLKKNLKLGLVERTILDNPFVEKAQVFLNLSGRLSIFIDQRNPLVRIMDAGGGYLDEQGEKMPRSSRYAHRVILARGIDLKKEKQEFVAFLKKIRADEFLKKMLVSIEKRKGKYILKTRLYNHSIHLGTSLQGLDGKFKKIKMFYARVTKYKAAKKYTDIYVFYKIQVVCKKKSLSAK